MQDGKSVSLERCERALAELAGREPDDTTARLKLALVRVEVLIIDQLTVLFKDLTPQDGTPETAPEAAPERKRGK